MYKTVSTDFTNDPDFNYDMLVFFSPSGITSLFKNFPNFEQGDTYIGCLGATAVKAAKDYVTTAIRHGIALGKGHGPTHHFVELWKKAGTGE